MFPEGDATHLGFFLVDMHTSHVVGSVHQVHQADALLLQQVDFVQVLLSRTGRFARYQAVSLTGQGGDEGLELLHHTQTILGMLTLRLYLSLLGRNQLLLHLHAVVDVDGYAAQVRWLALFVTTHNLASESIPLVLAGTLTIGREYGGDVESEVHLKHLVRTVDRRTLSHKNLLDIVGMDTFQHRRQFDVIVGVADPKAIQRRYPEAYNLLRDIPFPNIGLALVQEGIKLIVCLLFQCLPISIF